MKKKFETELTVCVCVANMVRSARFYEQGLGFVRVPTLEGSSSPPPEQELRLRHPDGRIGVTCISLDYARERMKTRLGALPGPFGGGVMLRLKVQDVDAAFAKALAGGGLSLDSPSTRKDGTREGCLRDPDGYLVSFVNEFQS